MNREHWNGYGLTPDDIPEPAGERDLDLLERPRYLHIPMTREEIEAAIKAMPAPQLTKRQAG